MQVIRKTKASNNRDFHDDPINTFELHFEQPLIISGDLKGLVCYSNYNTGEIGGAMGIHADSVESIAFCENPATPYCVSCAIDTKINIYNVKESSLRQSVTAAEHGGFTKIVFSKLDTFNFFASSTLGNIVVIDIRNGNLIRVYKGHQAPINDFIEVKEHKLLVSAGDDFVCNVYDLTKEP